jgi:thiamine-monophosphate kinase
MGLALLKGKSGIWDRLPAERRVAFVQRFRVPEPRLGLAPALAAYASAAMDVSDGLVGDCDKLATASGCSAVIEAESVPLPEGLSDRIGETELSALLTGGDDYEILAAVSPANEADFRQAAEGAGIPVARIGELVEGRGPTRVMLEGRAMALTKRAFVHGAKRG